MSHSRFGRATWRLVPVVACLAITACSSTPSKGDDDGASPTAPVISQSGAIEGGTLAEKHERIQHRRSLKLDAKQLYERAHKRLRSGNFAGASKEYGMLMSRFPFSRYATQAQLEEIYAKYRAYAPETAIADAQRFLREHPRHPHADYVLYLMGLINSSRDQNLTEYLPLDTSGHDPGYLRQAFQNFALLVRRYPKSRYRWDAHRRMVWLRNQIASHQMNIAQFYATRGAWLSAARRAQGVIANYPGAPATADALLMLKTCYGKLGLADQKKQVETLIAANQGSLEAARSDASSSADTPAAPPAKPNSAAVAPPTLATAAN